MCWCSFWVVWFVNKSRSPDLDLFKHYFTKLCCWKKLQATECNWISIRACDAHSKSIKMPSINLPHLHRVHLVPAFKVWPWNINLCRGGNFLERHVVLHDISLHARKEQGSECNATPTQPHASNRLTSKITTLSMMLPNHRKWSPLPSGAVPDLPTSTTGRCIVCKLTPSSQQWRRRFH